MSLKQMEGIVVAGVGLDVISRIVGNKPNETHPGTTAGDTIYGACKSDFARSPRVPKSQKTPGKMYFNDFSCLSV
jgi:hypothetical protein